MSTTVLSPVSNVADIPVKLIVADQKKNSRSHLTGIPELAKSIKNEGQQTPVQVAKRADGKFDLIWGFRRFAAISWSEKDGGLGWETIRATINEEEMSPKDRLLANLIENMAREDLTSYDAARSVAELRDMHPEDDKEHMSGQKIANNVGKSAQYVNNLLRCWDNLPELIKERWKNESAPNWKEKSNGAKPVLTTDKLNVLAKNSLTDEERILMYNELIGIKASGEGGGESEREPRNPNPALAKRASKSDLEKALAAAEGEKSKISADKEKAKGQAQKVEKLNGMIAALKFALGTNKTIPGVYTPEDDSDDE